jgi:branched-chain amino acid transport system substrate-binding protein
MYVEAQNKWAKCSKEKPEEVKQGWDLLDIRAIVPAASVIRPIDQGGCTTLDPM